jgi:hypothetical protein
MITRSLTGSAAIHAVARKHPELSLIASVLELAVADAKRGDQDAIAWLSSAYCAWYAGHLETDGVTAEEIQERLIEHATMKG